MKFLVLIGMLVLFSGFVGVAFAQTTHIINIPSGASDPNAPYFWQVERDGSPYFCIVHPWMVGNIIVTEGLSVLPKVGSQVGDGKTTFDLEYRFNRLIDNPSINVDQKSITFELIGNTNSQDHTLYIKMPSALLDGPYVVWVDGEKLADFEHEKQNDMNNLTIPLAENNKVLTIVGTKVVPEFGILSMVIFAIAVIGVVVISQKSKFQLHI